MIDRATRRRLLVLARSAMHASVRRDPPPEIPADLDVEAFGVFVTLYHLDDLRGCLGSLDCRGRIVASVARLAAAVTHEDPRFPPIRLQELGDTHLDLSVLTPPEPVSDYAAIEVGRHGLIVEDGVRRGLLLPQVAPEHGWDREAFLAQTCLKAGLSSQAWRQGAAVFRFEAEVFGERTE